MPINTSRPRGAISRHRALFLPLAGIMVAAGLGVGHSLCNKLGKRQMTARSAITLPISAPLISSPAPLPSGTSTQASASIATAAPIKDVRTESQQVEKMRLLAAEAGQNDFQFEEVELALPPAGDPNNPESTNRCREVKIDGQSIGFVNSWFPIGVVDLVLKGKEFHDLESIFPKPLLNINYEVTDLASGLPVGKHTYLWTTPGLYVFVWNDGSEQFFVAGTSKETLNLLYQTDQQVSEIRHPPSWRLEFDKSGTTMISITDPGVKLFMGDNEDGFNFFTRLQDSCSGDAKMLPQFLEVRQNNFSSFIKSLYGQEGD